MDTQVEKGSYSVWISMSSVLVILVIIVIILCIYFLVPRNPDVIREKYTDDQLSSGTVFLVDNPSVFYTIESTGGTEGRNHSGDYIKGSTTIEYGLGRTRDTNGRAELERYPLTYAIGHPYYDSGFGYLQGSSWNDHVLAVASPAQKYIGEYTDTDTQDKVLVVQGSTSTTNPVVSINKSSKFKGIVVRHGGVLLINDADIELRTEFILIESGGLFQAGSKFKDSHRFKNNFKLILISPDEGYIMMGAVCSQYSYMVYAPGVTHTTDPAKLMASYTGDTMNDFCNDFGAKCVGVGFNGNYHLSGAIGQPLVYKGTWGAFDLDNNVPFIDETTLMTYIDPSNIEQSKMFNIETAYPNTWCRLEEGVYKKGDTTIKLDSRDVGSDVLREWREGYQIVITCRTAEYTNVKDPVGMIPIWVDNRDPLNRRQNRTANDKFIAEFKQKGIDKSTGVEVATIKSINRTTGVITLSDPLEFNHYSTRIVLDRSGTSQLKPSKIRIDTNLHVGLLSRNILVTSEFNKNKETIPGCGRFKKNSQQKGKNGWNGPGGSVYCNYATPKPVGQRPPTTDIYDACYKPRTTNEDIDTRFCGKEQPAPVKGHWMFGTELLSGCQSIHGGHQMFMYGCCVSLDGVEIKYMGTPANFGKIARYPVHFHLAGFSKSFKSYLPKKGTNSLGGSDKSTVEYDTIYNRENTVNNCSIWCSFSRWVAIHGTNETDIKNNVGFVAYGSGYFVEDGTEINNTFEHNAAICCLTTGKHDYWNPIPLYANVASDLAPASAFWFKNNQNRCFRNLACNSPAPVIGMWGVPQNISRLRGPSTVLIGDEILDLPGLAPQHNAKGFQQSVGLSQYKNNNSNGSIMKFSPLNGRSTACWVPEYFYKIKPYADNERCIAFTNVNCENPYKLWAENIVYCMFSGISEFPEALADSVGDYYGCGSFGTTNGLNIGASKTKPVAQFIPANGQNSCTDEWNTLCTYFGTSFGGTEGSSYAFQPLDESEISSINSSDQKSVTIAGLQKANTVPKIFSNWLTLNLGPNAGELFGGSGWVKSSPGWLINCCFLMDGGGTATTNPNAPACLDATVAVWDKRSSSLFSMTCGDAVNSYPNAYFIIHNIITNGAFGLPPNPTIISGDKTFLSQTAFIYKVEYNVRNRFISSVDTYISNGSVQDYYFPDFDPLALAPIAFWKQPFTTYTNYNAPAQLDQKFNPFRLYNMKTNTVSIFTDDQNIKQNTPLNYTFSNNNYPNKYPYVCNKNNSMFKVSESKMPQYGKNNPEWNDIVINSQVGIFVNTYGVNLGNTFCKQLSQIVPCQKPVQQLFNEKSMC